MQSAHIIALIDAYLDRLIKARLILTTPDSSQGENQQATKPPLPLSGRRRVAERDKQPAPVSHLKKNRVSPRRRAKATGPEKLATENKPTAHRDVSVMSMPAEPNPIRENSHTRRPQDQGAPVEKDVASTQIAMAPSPRKVPASRKKSARSKPALTPGAKALGGLVPAGPIFIPAKQIRSEESQRQNGSVKGRDAFGSSVPLTAKLLAQRWMQSSILS